MFIRGIDRPNRKRRDYYVIESYWDKEAQTPRHRVIVSLGHDRNVDKAYRRAMADYLKASARLALFEQVFYHTSPGGPNSVANFKRRGQHVR